MWDSLELGSIQTYSHIVCGNIFFTAFIRCLFDKRTELQDCKQTLPWEKCP